MKTAPAPRWMTYVLVAAGIYNIIFGITAVAIPNWFFTTAGMPAPTYPFLWQCIGMIVGVYGLGYLAAAKAPLRYWPIVMVGFLGKIFGPIGFLDAATRGNIDWSFGYLILTNDLIWWIPFAMILHASWKQHRYPR